MLGYHDCGLLRFSFFLANVIVNESVTRRDQERRKTLRKSRRLREDILAVSETKQKCIFLSLPFLSPLFARVLRANKYY